MEKAQRISLGVAALAVSFFAGYSLRAPEKPATEVKTEIVYRDRIVERMVEKEVKRDVRKTVTKPDGTTIVIEDKSELKAKEEKKEKEKLISHEKAVTENKKNRRVSLRVDPMDYSPSVGVGMRAIGDVWLEAGASKSGDDKNLRFSVGIGFEF